MHRSSCSRWHAGFLALWCVFSPLLVSQAISADVGRQTVQPQDNGQALVNPGMGWTLHFYSNLIENYGSKLEPSDTLDDWPGLSVIYLRVPWSFLEPQEGRVQLVAVRHADAAVGRQGQEDRHPRELLRKLAAVRHAEMGAGRRRQGSRFRVRQRPARGRSAMGAGLSRSRLPGRSWTTSSPPWPGTTTAIRTSHSSTSARSACGAKGTPGFSSRLNEAQTWPW